MALPKIKITRFPNNCQVRILSAFPGNRQNTGQRRQTWYGSEAIYSTLKMDDASKILKAAENRARGFKLIANLAPSFQSVMIKAMEKAGWKRMARHAGQSGNIVWLTKHITKV